MAPVAAARSQSGCQIRRPNLATLPGYSTLLLGDHNTERSRRNESDEPGYERRYNPLQSFVPYEPV